MKKRSSIVTKVVVFTFLFSWVSASRVQALEDHWKPSAMVDLKEVAEKTAEKSKTDRRFAQQPTILALKTALFLATGSFDTPTAGKTQNIRAVFEGGEEEFKTAVVTVEFMGYADDSLFGERFTLELSVDSEGDWTVIKAERAAYGRGDHQ